MRTFPTIAELVSELTSVRDYMIGNCDFPPNDEDSYIDVRLQVTPSGWLFHSGLSDYDQDHRGHWGASSVTSDMTAKDLRDIARDMILQAKEMRAEERAWKRFNRQQDLEAMKAGQKIKV